MLRVGQYKVTAEASGFKSQSAETSLDVNQQREVDFTLAVAGTTTNVEVTALAPLVNTTNATLGGVVTGQEVATLPLNGRDITNLVFLEPGINYTGENRSIWYGEQWWSGNGNRGMTNTAVLDGLNSGDMEFGGAYFTGLNLDAISEFRVLQNNYSAEYGHGGGTIISLATKSGMNQFHGSAFEFLRNSALDSRGFFATSVPPFKRNEFGGTFGGPVKIPHVFNGTDRTFFFVEYAGFRQRRGDPILSAVPTAQERQGIVTITGQDGQPDQLMVPLNSVSQSVLNRYPLPNEPNGARGPRTFAFEYSVPENHDQWSTRIDHRFSSKDSIFGRFSYLNQRAPGGGLAAVEDPSFPGRTSNDQRNFGLTETHILSSVLLNTFSFGYTHTILINAPGNQMVPLTTFSDGSLSPWGASTFTAGYYEHNFSFHDAIDWVHGRHTMNFGAEFTRVRDNGFGASSGGPNGQFVFSPGTPLPVAIPSASGKNDIPAGTLSPSGMLSFLEGVPSTYNRSAPFPGFGPTGGGFAPWGVRRFGLNGWFQDNVKVTRNLTLNLGLRYEYNSVPWEVGNRLAAVVDDSQFKGGALYRQLVLNPRPLYFPDYRGYGPRFGLAYKLSDKTVLRAGYGIFTNLPPNVYPDQAAVGFPFASFSSRLNPPYSLTPLSVAGGPQPVLTDLSGNPLPPGGDTKKIPPNTPVNLTPVVQYYGGPITVDYTSMKLRNGYTMAGNVSLERQLPGDISWQISYVSNNAAKLYGSNWPNAYYNGAPPSATPYANVNPGLGEFVLTDNHSHSTYNALQTVLRKTSAQRGLQFQVSYTWSKSLDDSSTVWNAPDASGGTLQNNPDCWACEKGPSDFDFTHTLVFEFIYKLPFDKSRILSELPHRLTQGWQITSIGRAQSGFPFTVGSPYGTVQFGTDTYVSGYTTGTRPDLVQQPALKTGGGPEEQFFSDAVVQNPQNYFAMPGVQTLGVQSHPGNLGRDTFRSHPFSNFDFSLIKDTKFTERITLQFRSEFFNLFNQHAFFYPTAVLGAPDFGFSNSTVYSERQIQFGLRLIF
jgi:hypothetical protein